ncbi:hypothetical protein D3C84_898730 [compost metagenome]
MRTANRLLVVVTILRRLVLALLHHFGLAGKRPHQQLADAIEQPGGRVDDFQRRAEQGVAQRQDRVGIAGGEGARQVVGKHQQNRAGPQARGPWTVFSPGKNRQQRADDHYQRAAQGVAENQAVERKTQLCHRFVACTRGGALGQQVLVCRFNGGEQPRP